MKYEALTHNLGDLSYGVWNNDMQAFQYIEEWNGTKTLDLEVANKKAKDLNFAIDNDDMLILWGHTQQAYRGYTFEKWCNEVKEVYETIYLPNRVNPKTFCQWINAQIIAVAY